MKIVVGINSLVSTKHQAYSNHIQFFFRLGRSYPEVEVVLVNPARMSIDRMRNMAAITALQQDADYLLFLDDDVLVPALHSLQSLINCDADVAAGNVIIRGYPFQPMVFRYLEGTKTGLKPVENPPKTGIEDVDAVGFSLCLIKTSLLKKVRMPYFVTGPDTNTEDIYFCLKAREVVPDCTIKVDWGLHCAHILWEETIDCNNLENYKKYYETQYPDVLKKADEIDRGESYLEMIQKLGGIENET